MSNRTTTQKLARALQRLTRDDLGVKPKLQGCHNIIRDHGPLPNGSIEEKACRLFEAHRDQLKASGEKRAAYEAMPLPGEEQDK